MRDWEPGTRVAVPPLLTELEQRLSNALGSSLALLAVKPATASHAFHLSFDVQTLVDNNA